MTKEEKIIIFKKISNIIELNYDFILDCLIEVETYKTAVYEINKSIEYLKSFDKEINSIRKFPLGVCSVFLPFNNPLYSLLLYGFGCSLSGNIVYVKPSKLTSVSLMKVLSLFENELKLCDIYILNLDGKKFVEKLVNENHNAVIFTGQYNNAIEISKKVSNNVKFIYCGSGVCSLIVTKSAHLERAVDEAIFSRTFNSGQDCLSIEIIYIEKEIYDDFIKLMNKKIKKLCVGCNKNKNTDVGPLISDVHVDYVRRRLDKYKNNIILEGKIRDRFIEPFVLEFINSIEIPYEEWFAPIFSVVKCDNIEQISKLVNDNHYQLGITIFGNEKYDELFDGFHIVYNSSLMDYEKDENHSPFGGKKKSGFVMENGNKFDGPILFSNLTSRN